jgi:hypothetical protein
MILIACYLIIAGLNLHWTLYIIVTALYVIRWFGRRMRMTHVDTRLKGLEDSIANTGANLASDIRHIRMLLTRNRAND